MAAAALLRQAGALGADGVRKGGGDYLVFVRKAGVPVPVEVPVHGTVADLRAAVELGPAARLLYQGEALRDADSLADRGIGPQAVVEALEILGPESERELLVAGAGLEEVNGIYELLREENGATCWVKRGDHKMVMHWYWGPVVNGRKIDGWLLGRSRYDVTDLAYACGVRMEQGGAVIDDIPDRLSTIDRNARLLPPHGGWETAGHYEYGTAAIGKDPPPQLYGALVLAPEEYESV
eukprot:TRINITY_DN9140_c0_g1_i1.p1 TRINITY_DN9140_c0_g1~~TRINITY_DN9140_c0_g1_i1.p1  ORF type:complete len:256 (+),score=65.29 TRINITY_DN9140_c0_g1_i1:60-770(+)